jgi:hypothetical protein
VSKENVAGFFTSLTGAGEAGLADDPAAADVIGYASQQGFEFSEEDLHSVMKEMIHTAQSLPGGWGWKLARTLGLVRNN